MLPLHYVPIYLFTVERVSQKSILIVTVVWLSYCKRYNNKIIALEQYTGFEPVPSAWKADMLAIEHQYCISTKTFK